MKNIMTRANELKDEIDFINKIEKPSDDSRLGSELNFLMSKIEEVEKNKTSSEKVLNEKLDDIYEQLNEVKELF